MGGTGNDQGNPISADSSGNIYITGLFSGIASFDENTSLTSIKGDDIFIAKYNSSGDLQWVKQTEGTENIDNEGYSINIDSSNNIYVTGYIYGTTTLFDDISLTPSENNSDTFLLKIEQEAEISSPTLSTSSASSISKSGATLNAEVTDEGGETPTEVGFQYGEDTEYGTSVESDNYSSGTFSYDLSDLDCNTTYHYRAYATNSAGTTNGSDTTFTTSKCPSSGSRVVGGYIHSSSSNNTNTNNTQTTTTNTNNTTTTTTQSQLSFTKILKLNVISDDVKLLQQWLNNHGYTISQTGPGSKGNETNKFGPLTKKAVIAFQKANNLTPDGIVGPMTLKKMNEVK